MEIFFDAGTIRNTSVFAVREEIIEDIRDSFGKKVVRYLSELQVLVFEFWLLIYEWCFGGDVGIEFEFNLVLRVVQIFLNFHEFRNTFFVFLFLCSSSSTCIFFFPFFFFDILISSLETLS